MTRIYRYAALATFVYLMFVWANAAFRWQVFDIAPRNSLEAIIIGGIAIWGFSFGLQWTMAEPGEFKMPKWLGIVLMTLLVMAAAAAGRILIR